MKPTKAQELALDMNKSVCVTASAGTGKTFILTQRYIKSLRTGVDVGKILALTYTDKAAAEMREKIEREIRKESKETGEFKEVLENIHKCSISTFHGFCASLLKEFPIEAGVEPGFSVMDELDKSELVNDTISDILKNPPEFLKEDLIYLYRFVASKTLKDSINYLLSKWSECSFWFERLRNNSDEIAEEWKNICISNIIESKDKILSDEKFTELIGIIRCIDKNPCIVRTKCYDNLKESNNYEDDYKNIVDLVKKIPDLNLKTFPQIPQNLFDYCSKFIKKISLYDVRLLTDENIKYVFSVLNALGDVVSYINGRIISEKERASVLDFDDLVRFTSKLMEKEDVVETLRERYEYILVDEVQDNDPILTGIVKKICGDAAGSGKLFIVGDVKQSIYGFRGSDPKGFFELMKMFSSEPVSLDKSFRTVPEIIESVNNIFADVFSNSKIRYQNITTSRENESGTITVLKNIPKDKQSSEEKADSECCLIASWLKENIGRLEVYENGEKRPSKYSDAAILLRTRTKINNLKRILEKYDVPYFEYKGRDFYKSQEIYDIVTVLKAIAFPEDDVFLYGALRSPYFGVSDAVLCRCSAEGTEKSLLSRLENSNEPEIISALNMLKSFAKLSHELTLVRFVEEVIRRCGILSVYSALPSGEDEIGNLEKFVDMVSAKTVGTALSLPAFLKTVETCIEEEISEESSSGEDDLDNSDRVKILTIHASKGLEYPIVILAFASNKKIYGGNSYLFDSIAGFSLTLKDSNGNNIPSFVYNSTKSEILTREDEEARRLYYVGLTRARDHLVVSETESDKFNETSFIGMHEVEGGEVISEYNLPPEKTSDSNICNPLDWEEIMPESDEILCTPDKINVDEYLLAKGSCLHEIFAGADIAETTKRYGLLDCADEFSKDLEEFMNCELMEGVVESRCELPVSFCDENKRIDRLVKYTDGSYSIIDYKLGSREGISDELAEKYKQQLTRYSELMTKILGCEVSAYLYFVGGKKGGRVLRIV